MAAVADTLTASGELDAELLQRKSNDLKEKLGIFQQELSKAHRVVAEASSQARHRGGTGKRWRGRKEKRRGREWAPGQASIMKECTEAAHLKKKQDELSAVSSGLEHHIGGLRELLRKAQALLPK